MKKLIFALALCICACQDEPRLPLSPPVTVQQPAKEAVIQPEVKKRKPDYRLAARRYRALLKKHAPSSQKFMVSATKPSTVQGKLGTVIHVDPSVFADAKGLGPSGDIEIELREFRDPADFVFEGLPTVSQGKLLESGGAYFIGASSGGKELRIKKGKTLKVDFPKTTDAPMQIFYGKRDSLGNLSWRPDTQVFRQRNVTMSEFPPAVQAAPRTDTVYSLIARDLTASELSNIKSIEQMVRFQKKRELTESEKIRIKRQQEEAEKEMKLYQSSSLASLGYINCDRFYDVPEKCDMLVKLNLKDTIETAIVFLVFKDIRSAMQQYYFCDSGQELCFRNVPKDHKVTLLALSVKGNTVLASSMDLSLGEKHEVQINLEPMAERDWLARVK